MWNDKVISMPLDICSREWDASKSLTLYPRYHGPLWQHRLSNEGCLLLLWSQTQLRFDRFLRSCCLMRMKEPEWKYLNTFLWGKFSTTYSTISLPGCIISYSLTFFYLNQWHAFCLVKHKYIRKKLGFSSWQNSNGITKKHIFSIKHHYVLSFKLSWKIHY